MATSQRDRTLRSSRIPRLQRAMQVRATSANEGVPSDLHPLDDSESLRVSSSRPPIVQGERILMANPIITTQNDHGAHANVTVHFHLPGTPPQTQTQPSETRDSNAMPPGPELPLQGSLDLTDDTSQHPYGQQRYRRSANTIYESQLIGNRGFPLWIPQPNMRLPKQYRTQGIAIGDVGVITDLGAFDFLFNICLPADHPINPSELPEGFTQLPLNTLDVREFREFPSGSYLTSSTVKRAKQAGNDRQETIFESSASEGAVLTMPHGAYHEELSNVIGFHKYMATNIESWYRFVNGPRGRDVKNGDIRLVVGYDKATAWGMACFSNSSTQCAFSLTFSSSHQHGLSTGCPYIWEHTGTSADVKAGPDTEDNEGLSQASSPPLRNQCLFVKTLNALLADDVWSSLKIRTAQSIRPRKSPKVTTRHFQHEPHGTSQETSSTSHRNPTDSPSYPKVGRKAAPMDQYESTSISSSDGLVPLQVTLPSTLPPASHPSFNINSWLLQEAAIPGCKVVISHDSVWSSWHPVPPGIFRNEIEAPDRRDHSATCAKILERHNIVWSEDHKWASLDLKDCSYESRGRDLASIRTMISDLRNQDCTIGTYLFGPESQLFSVDHRKYISEVIAFFEAPENYVSSPQNLSLQYLKHHPRRPIVIDEILHILHESLILDDCMLSRTISGLREELGQVTFRGNPVQPHCSTPLRLANMLLLRGFDFSDKDSIDEAIWYFQQALNRFGVVQGSSSYHYFEIVQGLSNAFYGRYQLLCHKDDLDSMLRYLRLQRDVESSNFFDAIQNQIGACCGLISLEGDVESRFNAAAVRLRSIFRHVRELQGSREQFIDLSTFATSIVLSLDKHHRSATAQQMTQLYLEPPTAKAIEDMTNLLCEIADFVQRRRSLKFVQCVLLRDSTESIIKEYNIQLDKLADMLQLAGVAICGVHVGHMKDQRDMAVRVDRAGQSFLLAQAIVDPESMKQTLNIQQGSELALMATFQLRLRDKPSNADPMELEFFAHSLQYLEAKTGQTVDIQPWTISPFDVEFGPELGSGGFGRVCKGTWNQMNVTLKVMKNREMISPNVEAIRRQVHIWSKLQHPHILQFLGANILDDNPFVVTPLMPNGNIRSYIQKNPTCDRLRFVSHIAAGLAYLHSKNVFHGDLKGVNVLIDNGNRAILCDFGLSRIKADVNSRSFSESMVTVSSHNWMAPELLTGGRPSAPSDIYSFGMTVYEIYTNETPLGHLSPGTMRDVVIGSNTRPDRPGQHEAPTLTEDVWRLATECWAAQPALRPAAPIICDKLKNIYSNQGQYVAPKPMPPAQTPYPVTLQPPTAIREPEMSEMIISESPASRVNSSTIPSLINKLTGKRSLFARLVKSDAMEQPHKRVIVLENPANAICLTQSPDGKDIIVGMSNGYSESWDGNDGSALFPVSEDICRPEIGGIITSMGYIKGGTKDARDSSVYLIGSTTGAVAHHPSMGGFTTILTGNQDPILCLTENGKEIIVLTKTHELHTWTLRPTYNTRRREDKKLSTTPLEKLNNQVCTCGAFSPDSTKVYAGTSDGVLLISDVKTGGVLRRQLASSTDTAWNGPYGPTPSSSSGTPTIPSCRHVVASPDGKKVAVSYNTGEVRVWDVKSGEYDIINNGTPNLDLPRQHPFPIAYSSDGSKLAFPDLSVDVANTEKVIHLRDSGFGERVAVVMLKGCPAAHIQTIDFAVKGKRLILTFTDCKEVFIFVWD